MNRRQTPPAYLNPNCQPESLGAPGFCRVNARNWISVNPYFASRSGLNQPSNVKLLVSVKLLPIFVATRHSHAVRAKGRNEPQLASWNAGAELMFMLGGNPAKADSMSMPWLVAINLLAVRKSPFISHPPTDDTGLIVPSDWRSSFQ